MAPNGRHTGGEIKEKYVLDRTLGALGLQMDARSAQSHQNGAQSLPNSANMGAKNLNMEPTNNKKTLRKLLENWRAFCPSLLMTEKTGPPGDAKQPITPSTNQPIHQSTNRTINRSTGPSAVAGMAEGSWIICTKHKQIAWIS